MPPSVCTYSEAVYYAADSLLTSESLSANILTEKLADLLYSLAKSIPAAWGTATRQALILHESNMDTLLRFVAEDLSIESLETSKYLVLSSICQLILLIRQRGGSCVRQGYANNGRTFTF